MTTSTDRVSPAWLMLREPADAAARALDLVDSVQAALPAGGGAVIHDLGCGTGSMGRWLAPRLAGSQHWILYDRDPELLARAAFDMPAAAADGAPVTVETRERDITRLDRRDLADSSLITASALLDMLTADEVERIVVAAGEAACPVLFTLSVIGRVELTPADPLDESIQAAFNAHQRRSTGGRQLLGPDAVDVAADALARLGAEVLVRASPWRLGADDSALVTEWLIGWIGAACEQRLDLTVAADGYRQRRLAAAAAGGLGVAVHHRDILALPQ